jgi:hypothetical protein
MTSNRCGIQHGNLYGLMCIIFGSLSGVHDRESVNDNDCREDRDIMYRTNSEIYE